MQETVGNAHAGKRKLHEFTSDESARMHADVTPASVDATTTAPAQEQWQSVDRTARKRQKKLDKNYPALSHSNNARLHSFVKISDLQNLVLYLLADGTGPQWISVRHHQNFSKVVVLMVPGLDVDLFTGAVALDDVSTEVRESSKNDCKSMHHTTPSADDRDKVSMDEQGAHHEAEQEQSDHSSPYLHKLTISPDNYFPTKLATQKLPLPLQPFASIFTHLWQVKTPGDQRRIHSPMYAILSSPIPKPKEDKNKKGAKPPPEAKDWVNRPAAITEYIATKSELVENGFALHPVHLASENERIAEKARRHKAVQSPDDGFVDVLDIKSVTDGLAHDAETRGDPLMKGRKLLVIDCEMVTTTVDRFALARVSLLDSQGKVVMDELVKPAQPIKDYLTPYSGITPEMMQNVTTTLADIQTRLKALLTPQTILAGHSLDSDFRALKMAYPFVVDTTLLYPHPKGPPQKSSLKWLAQKYLGRDIQQNSVKGHDSVEDALACLDLIKQKVEKGKMWGTADAQGESIFKRLARNPRRLKRARDDKVAESQNGHGDHPEAGEDFPNNTSAILDWTGNMHGFASSATVAITCKDDDEVVQGAIDAIIGKKDRTPPVPSGGCDFVFARMRELEFQRGWSPGVVTTATSTATESGTANTDIKLDVNAGGETYHHSGSDAPTAQLTAAVNATVSRISRIYEAVPERTAFIVMSGSGDPRGMIEWQRKYAAHKAEYLTTKWDEMVNKWDDNDQQAAANAAKRAKSGVAFIGVR